MGSVNITINVSHDMIKRGRLKGFAHVNKKIVFMTEYNPRDNFNVRIWWLNNKYVRRHKEMSRLKTAMSNYQYYRQGLKFSLKSYRLLFSNNARAWMLGKQNADVYEGVMKMIRPEVYR